MSLSASPTTSQPRTDGPPGGRPEEAAEHADGRRLSRAVRPDEPEHLPFPDLEVEGTDGFDILESPAEAPGLDGEFRHGPALPLYFPAGPTRIAASAGRPGLSRPSRFSISTLTPKTSLTRSSFVWMFFGVNSASGEM